MGFCCQGDSGGFGFGFGLAVAVARVRVRVRAFDFGVGWSAVRCSAVQCSAALTTGLTGFLFYWLSCPRLRRPVVFSSFLLQAGRKEGKDALEAASVPCTKMGQKRQREKDVQRSICIVRAIDGGTSFNLYLCVCVCVCINSFDSFLAVTQSLSHSVSQSSLTVQ